MTDYGTCMSCTDDLHLGRSVSGEDVIIEMVHRMLSTRKGSVIDALEWGIDLEELLSEDLDRTTLAKLGPTIAAELRRDPRILTAKASTSWDPAAFELTVELELTLATGTLPLVLKAARGVLTVERLRR